MGDKGSKNVLEKEGAEMPINSADQTFRRLRGISGNSTRTSNQERTSFE